MPSLAQHFASQIMPLAGSSDPLSRNIKLGIFREMVHSATDIHATETGITIHYYPDGSSTITSPTTRANPSIVEEA